MRRRILLGMAMLALALPGVGQGADWPQWRGLHRDAHSPETGLLKTWPEGGPALSWTYSDGGTGYSEPIVVGERIYLLGARKDTEMVIALSTDGKELWASPIGPVFDFDSNAWSRGPNSTPCADGDQLFAMGSQGILVCVAAKDGSLTWKKDLRKELSAQVNDVGGGSGNMGWGFSWSPLVDGDRLIITPGGPKGLVAALNKKTGEVIWQSKEVTDQCTYASPMTTEVDGVRQYVAMTQKGAVGVAAADGKLLWRYDRKLGEYRDVVCVTPLVDKGEVLITATRGPVELLKVEKDGDGFKVSQVYLSRRMSNFHGGLVRVGKYVYGSYESRSWKCMDYTNGEIVWDSSSSDPGPGSLIYADGNLYCLTERPDVVSLIEASHEGCKVKGSFKLPKVSTLRKPSGRLWTHPVISNGCLYVRDQELLFCYKVK